MIVVFYSVSIAVGSCWGFMFEVSFSLSCCHITWISAQSTEPVPLLTSRKHTQHGLGEPWAESQQALTERRCRNPANWNLGLADLPVCSALLSGGHCCSSLCAVAHKSLHWELTHPYSEGCEKLFWALETSQVSVPAVKSQWNQMQSLTPPRLTWRSISSSGLCCCHIPLRFSQPSHQETS